MFIDHKEIDNISIKKNHSIRISEFSLYLDWTLKVNQKFGKRDIGKKISSEIKILLERYFLTGNVNKSDRYTA